jgi:predicted hotdog family 3-hydroxylacyl-ACP dehydratase
MPLTEFAPVTELIPHRGALLLIDRVLEHDGGSTTVRVLAGAGGWLQRGDGTVPPWLALEYMAQCSAAHEGLRARAEGRDLPRGFLVSAQRVKLQGSGFRCDEVLRVSARLVRGRPGLGALSYLCSIWGDPGGSPDPIAEGRLSVSLHGPSAMAAGLPSGD